MKKLLSLLLMLAILMTITGCSSGDAKEKLKNYLIENGEKTVSDLYYVKSYEYRSSNYDTYFIYYDEDDDEIYFASFQDDDVVNSPSSLHAKQYAKIPVDYNSEYSRVSYCYSQSIYYVVDGEINKKKYSKSNDKIENLEVSGSFSKGNDIAKSLAESQIATLLSKVEDILDDLNVDVTLNSLGFTNY